MNNKSKQSITIPAEVLGLSDVEIESVTTDLRARQITIRVVSRGSRRKPPKFPKSNHLIQ